MFGLPSGVAVAMRATTRADAIGALRAAVVAST
jgi:hypothetical protein